MPTRRRRISVVRDPELGDALEAARPRLHAATEAGQLRELALLGARSVTGAASARTVEAREALRREHRATPERYDLVRTARKLLRAARGGESATESLAWVRGSR